MASANDNPKTATPMSAAVKERLSFFVSEKNGILVVSMVGGLLKSSQDTLKECMEVVAKSSAQSVILNLHGVHTVEKGIVPDFVKLQSEVRRKPAELRLCFIAPQIVSFLSEAGIIRTNEISLGLKEALVSLPARKAV